MKRVSPVVFIAIAAALAAFIWLASGTVPALGSFRQLLTIGTFVLVSGYGLVKSRGIPAPIKAVALMVMGVVGYALHASLGLSVVALLLPLGKWWALAIHFVGGWVQAALILLLGRAGLIIAWQRKAEARLNTPFWQSVRKWGLLPAAIFVSVVISPILAAFLVLISGVGRGKAWVYVTIAVATTSVSWIFFGDQIGIGALFSQIGTAIGDMFH